MGRAGGTAPNLGVVQNRKGLRTLTTQESHGFSRGSVKVEIRDENGKVVARYRNFDPARYEVDPDGEWDHIWGNQTESFVVPDVEVARKIIESNGDYLPF